MAYNICSLVLTLTWLLLYIKTIRNTKKQLKQKSSVYHRSLTVTVLNKAILRIISQKKKKKKKKKKNKKKKKKKKGKKKYSAKIYGEHTK